MYYLVEIIFSRAFLSRIKSVDPKRSLDKFYLMKLIMGMVYFPSIALCRYLLIVDFPDPNLIVVVISNALIFDSLFTLIKYFVSSKMAKKAYNFTRDEFETKSKDSSRIKVFSGYFLIKEKQYWTILRTDSFIW